MWRGTRERCAGVDDGDESHGYELFVAVRHNRPDIVRWLLAHPLLGPANLRILAAAPEPSCWSSDIWCVAALTGNADLVRLLMSWPGIRRPTHPLRVLQRAPTGLTGQETGAAAVRSAGQR